jgi:hypothetical protein
LAKVSRCFIALVAFVVALRCSGILVYEITRLFYSADTLRVIPGFASAACFTIGTLCAAVMLLCGRLHRGS